MEFSWTDEQADLRSAVRRVLDTKAPVSRARELSESGDRYDPELWEMFSRQLGLQGLGISEELGGSGGTLVDVAVVMEEMGAVLYGGLFLSTAVLAVGVLSAFPDDASAQELLSRIAAGEVTAAVAAVEADGKWAPDSIRTTAGGSDGEVLVSGVKHLVLDGMDADIVLVLARGEDGLDWYVIERGSSQLTRVPRRVLDGTRPMALLEFDEAPGRRLGGPAAGWEAAAQMLQTSSILLAAEQVGAAGELVRRTADYAKTRRQFGRPIGSFQGVKHRLADMHVRYELARSAAYWAAWQSPGSQEAQVGALVARSYCSDALLQTAKDTIQLHGGIGFTWEHDAHLYLRRARLDASLLGSSSSAREALLPHVLEGVTR